MTSSYKKTLKNLLFLAAYWLAFVLYSLSATAQHEHAPSTDKPSTHGMLFFGGEKAQNIYASHLPMFYTPHDYQVIIELEIPDSARTAYQQSLHATPQETVYTIVPEVFVLPQMIAAPRPFKVQLYCGHFERGGKAITGYFTVSIKRILYFKKFDSAALRLPTAQYLVFGSPEAQYAAHVISARPDFDHIVRLANTPLTAQKLQNNATTTFRVAQQNTPQKTGTMRAINTLSQKPRVITFATSLYLEFDDLKQ